MWCTRWYLPLALLAVPTASPYFLVLFLFMTTLQARPCIYCIMLVTLSFISSCYWAPLPIDSSLAAPWSENVTTFADALHSVMPNLTKEELPGMIPLAERCWCHLAGTNFFDPFNVTHWELTSVMRVKEDLERRRTAAVTVAAEPEGPTPGAQACTNASQTVGEHFVEAVVTPTPSPRSLILWRFFYRWDRSPDPVSPTSSPYPAERSEPSPSTERQADELLFAPPQPFASSGTPPPQNLPLFRKEYDLHPYGFAVILDFGWTSQP